MSNLFEILKINVKANFDLKYPSKESGNDLKLRKIA
jgi:hypothetical protein